MRRKVVAMTGIKSRSSQSEANAIACFIGLPRWKDVDDLGLVERVSKGFPLSAATNIIQRIDPDGRFMRVTDIIPKSTFHRKERNKQPLSKDESEKVLALSKVFSEALRIYNGDRQKCAQFLAHPHPMLGSRSPLELARESIAGADLVLKMLSKADAGVAV